jgi:hypothetical protein
MKVTGWESPERHPCNNVRESPMMSSLRQTDIHTIPVSDATGTIHKGKIMANMPELLYYGYIS